MFPSFWLLPASSVQISTFRKKPRFKNQSPILQACDESNWNRRYITREKQAKYKQGSKPKETSVIQNTSTQGVSNSLKFW